MTHIYREKVARTLGTMEGKKGIQYEDERTYAANTDPDGTGFSNYYAANMPVKAGRPCLVQHLLRA
jgi:hypothetical protein